MPASLSGPMCRSPSQPRPAALSSRSELPSLGGSTLLGIVRLLARQSAREWLCAEREPAVERAEQRGRVA